MQRTLAADKWAALYHFLSYGMEVPSDLHEYYEMNDYMQKFLIPIKLMTTTHGQEDINYPLLSEATEESIEYLDDLPVYMGTDRFCAYMQDAFGTYCWIHCLKELVVQYGKSTGDWETRLRVAIDAVLYNYEKRYVSFSVDAYDVEIYVHKLTHASIGDYPSSEFLLYPKSIPASVGSYTVRSLCNRNPHELSTVERKLLIDALEVPVLLKTDLQEMSYDVPVNGNREYLSLDATSPLLPPKSVFDAIRDLEHDSNFMSGYTDEYCALHNWVTQGGRGLVDHEVIAWLEQNKAYFGESCDASSVETAQVDLSDFTTEEIISEAAHRLGVEVSAINSLAFGLTDKEVLDYVSGFTGRTYTSLRELTDAVNDTSVVEYINQKIGTDFSSISELVDTSTRKLEEADILNWIKEYTGKSFTSVKELTETVTGDSALQASYSILKYLRSVLNENTPLDERVKTVKLMSIAQALAVSHDKGQSMVIAMRVALNGIPEDRPEYMSVAREAVNQYLGEAVF